MVEHITLETIVNTIEKNFPNVAIVFYETKDKKVKIRAEFPYIMISPTKEEIQKEIDEIGFYDPKKIIFSAVDVNYRKNPAEN